MKAITTIVSEDKIGIVAGISAKIAELGLNTDDTSQAASGDFFTTVAVVSSDEKQDFIYLRSEFEAYGETLNAKTNIQSEVIFDAIYNI